MTKKKADGAIAPRLEPETVLQCQLEYLHNLCLKHAQAIATKLKEDGASGAELARHYDNIVKAREQLIKVSATLIPYRKPRLESIEVKQEVEHRFVVVSPIPIKSHEDFLKTIAAPNQAPLLVGSGNKPLNILDIPSGSREFGSKEADATIQRFLDIPKDIPETPESKRRMYLED